jgi:hypothetical protein
LGQLALFTSGTLGPVGQPADFIVDGMPWEPGYLTDLSGERRLARTGNAVDQNPLRVRPSFESANPAISFSSHQLILAQRDLAAER